MASRVMVTRKATSSLPIVGYRLHSISAWLTNDYLMFI